ncbi:hypothetical protein SARC_03295 [Sphaeroforma arctica JP610]|uniref:Uncharacterized protein n=1 Tax=Sphaeroforma arctica JP610 TaxID=667725 RepID=A0A0L0G633_9EUKA|nr:hypothetical protein SARC_03295 [Sphaeroforma arctica JP610]KNC84490.1 hypothetical protein SARC_03295 [Sphaeroforma arctica JP610]|eukprot:XP_014158392.1 hypothetical protein SARC_03295 [Sphaeroforma arctica JP610]
MLPPRQTVASAHVAEPQLNSEQALAQDIAPRYPYNRDLTKPSRDRIRPEAVLSYMTSLPAQPRDLGNTIGTFKYLYPAVFLSAKLNDAPENYDAA